ncbi:hypothetical protein [Prevotella melaninogenica]|uniref:hypothetical protein n=1 Tax=Prevotella melaninogenica TaxID=28132 RepID=UPI0028ED93B8|nr:hypothetical protein [Prevotella melaninogenica]
MSQKKNNKRLLAVLTMVLFSIVSFAQGVKLADGVEPLSADAETPGSEYTLVFHDEFNEPDGTLPNTKVWRDCTSYPKIYSLLGAKMGAHESELPKGIYVLNGKKFVK